MKKYAGKSKFQRFLAGKGFYAALGVCLLGAGVAAWVSIDRTMNSLDQIGYSSSEPSSFTEPAGEEPAETSQPDIPKDSSQQESSQPSDLQDGQQSSSSEQTNASVNSEQSTVSTKLPTAAYVYPVNGEIFATYSGDKLVYNQTMGDWRTHNGIDLKAEQGSDILAVSAGTVTRIYEDALWGKVVEIDHGDDLFSLYCGLDEVRVQQGDEVKMEQVIGTLGVAPAEVSLDSHLHFAMKQDGKWIDPTVIVEKKEQ